MGAHSDRSPVEKKVTAATVGTFASSAVVAVLNAWVADATLLGSLPGWLQMLVIALGPTGVTFVSGYLAKHTPRPADESTVRLKSV
jgi:hypothetical protein